MPVKYCDPIMSSICDDVLMVTYSCTGIRLESTCQPMASMTIRSAAVPQSGGSIGLKGATLCISFSTPARSTPTSAEDAAKPVTPSRAEAIAQGLETLMASPPMRQALADRSLREGAGDNKGTSTSPGDGRRQKEES